MKLREIYSYDNQKFAELKEPAREVVAAYQNAARWLDTTQEWVYIETGMTNVARAIHNLAHEMPKRFDVFGDMLHERHLATEYPATAELTEEFGDMDKVFETVINILGEIEEALEKFREATDNAEFRAMSLKTEELQLQISGDYTKFLEMWQMWDEFDGSITSFDNWVKHLTEG